MKNLNKLEWLDLIAMINEEINYHALNNQNIDTLIREMFNRHVELDNTRKTLLYELKGEAAKTKGLKVMYSEAYAKNLQLLEHMEQIYDFLTTEKAYPVITDLIHKEVEEFKFNKAEDKRFEEMAAAMEKEGEK